MSVKSIKSTFSVAIVTVFSIFFVTDEAGGISARNVLQTFEHCDWCAGIFWKREHQHSKTSLNNSTAVRQHIGSSTPTPKRKYVLLSVRPPEAVSIASECWCQAIDHLQSVLNFTIYPARMWSSWTKTTPTDARVPNRGPCALCHGIQYSMEAILACHPAIHRMTGWVAISCELWHMQQAPSHQN